MIVLFIIIYHAQCTHINPPRILRNNFDPIYICSAILQGISFSGLSPKLDVATLVFRPSLPLSCCRLAWVVDLWMGHWLEYIVE